MTIMCSVSQRKARNDDENKKKVAAMFEDSGSEESEKEIKTMVNRIVEESGKADQANSEGAVVELSIINNHLMTLINKNLTVTNKICKKVKSLEKSQSELLGTIEELFLLVNPVVNLTSQDVPEQHEPLLAMFTPGILEQPQLELSLKGSQNVCEQNVSPVFSFNLPEQPQQGNQILTINTNDLRDCAASAAHPEMGDSSDVLDIGMDTLVKLKNKACSETNFAVQVFKSFFKDEEIKNKNSRVKGKEPLDPVRIEKIKRYFFEIYPCVEEEDKKKKWSKACEGINNYIRGQKRAKRKQTK